LPLIFFLTNKNFIMSKVTLADLKIAAKELNEFLGIDPAIEVGKKATEATLESGIKEAVKLLEDGELEELEPVTQKVCAMYLEIDEEEEEEEEEAPAPAKSKKPATAPKAAPATTPAPKKGGKPAPVKEIDEEIDEEEEEAPAPKKGGKVAEKVATKPAAKSEKAAASGKGQKGFKGIGIIATIVETIQKAGKAGITHDEIHAVLVKKFPERAADSMKNTVKLQVPRCLRESGKLIVEQNKQGRWIAVDKK